MIQEENRRRSDNIVKILLIGDSGVGKTNLITRYCQSYYKQSYSSTIGVDFKIKIVPIEEKVLKLQIWDTAGQQRFTNLTKNYYKGAHGIIVCYSIIDKLSFQNISKWIKQIQLNSWIDIPIMILANKCDLEDQRINTQQDGIKFAEKYQLQYMEVSAKTGANVQQAFNFFAKIIKHKIHEIEMNAQADKSLSEIESNECIKLENRKDRIKLCKC